MYSKEESRRMKQEFWTAFGKSFPRKWILYNTKLKDFSFKFYIDRKQAEVSLNIEMPDELFRNVYFEKLQSLEVILREYIGAFSMDENYVLPNNKIVSRVWITKENVSIYNKDTWREVFEFFYAKMDGFEQFYLEYEDFIKDV